ncbi:MAG TPA: VOC family protein [Acidimicrobiales bacterium]|nr:VOC family protein [Acidimicrobiales bacterium]
MPSAAAENSKDPLAPTDSTRDLSSAIRLDHVAIAVEKWSDAWPRYVGMLGGTWAAGGFNVGFSPHQLRFSNEGRLEVLQPWNWMENDFLRRFLDNNGPGPHHITFKVTDINKSLEAVRRMKLEPVGVNFDDPGWKEAFLHPREACGVVVQLAQASGGWESSPAPEGFPMNRGRLRAERAAFVRITHAVADLSAALDLFSGLLRGEVVGRYESPDESWECVDIAWSEPPGLRVVAPSSRSNDEGSLREWLGGRPGRVHHLVFSGSDSRPPTTPGEFGSVPGVMAGEHVTAVIEPAENLGTRLVLVGGAP